MRVLLLSAVGEVGGAERVLLDLVRFASPAVRFGLVCMADGPLVAAARAAGAAEVWVNPWPPAVTAAGETGLSSGAYAAAELPRMAAALLRATPALRRTVSGVDGAISDFGPDVVHSNNLKTHLLTGRLKLGRARLVWHLHDFLGSRRLASLVLPWSAGRADVLVAISAAVARDARAIFGGLTPVVTVHDGVDTARFAPGPADPAAGLGDASADGLVRVGLVATYARWKGQDVFIEAVSRLPDAVRRRARFYIVGGPIYRTGGSQWSVGELQARIDAAGLTDSLRLTGFRDDPPSVYRALDVVVHASVCPEPFGLTIAESMACGRATVVGAAGGAVELFEPGRSAVAVACGNPAGLAQALATLIADGNLRDRLGQAARRHVVTHFNIDAFADRWIRLYYLLAGRGEPTSPIFA